ncbi:putative CxxC motif protein [Halorubrum virus Serpecor1]|uniref:Putative CxxC motif protein n=1 Tax=Halorubrum virus Serpecor1 TaxID=2721757 RepID=A0A6G9RZH9_9CAUD|nr:putative CxxC motif protein [Halorubrum virus Serpecor1]QIR31274.1 putative CxxC motif protein [Halorubrum virus Serpecor1]
MNCERCGGLRLNGAPVVKEDGEYRLATLNDGEASKEYFCRSCVIEVTQ